MSVLHTVVARLYARGADNRQVGLVLGIRHRGAVRQKLQRVRPSMSRLIKELV